MFGKIWFNFIQRQYTHFSPGCIEVSRASIEHVLTKMGKGNAVVIVVGGLDETWKSYPGSYDIILFAKKGFVKLAIQCG